MTDPRTDDDLMLAFGRGASAAFEVLYDRYRKPLYRYLYHAVGDRATADDLYQDVWSRIIDSRTRFRRGNGFRRWAFRIAHNRLVDHWRRAGRQPGIDSDRLDAVPADERERPDAGLERDQQADRLRRALMQLPAAQREAFLLQQEAGLSLADIAGRDGVGRETVKSRLGGLATASVAIVAIAVVMQQTPPGESTPGTIGPTGLQEPKAFMAPSVGVPAASEAQREPDRSSSDAGSVESTAPARARPATDVASMRSTAPESEGVTQAERPAPDRNVGEKAGIGDERDFAISPEITDDPDAMLDEIRGLLDAGKTGQARAWLERLRSTHPDHVVPKDIEQALEEEASDR